jgi:phage gp46-like protein
MTRIAYDSSSKVFDLAMAADGNIEDEDGLYTACVLSLFEDRRASDDELLPPEDQRGYWGDAFPEVAGDLSGSRLWLLARKPATDETLRLAEEYSREALQWMIDDGIAEEITARASRYSADVLRIEVGIKKPGETAPRWLGPWGVHINGV